MSNKMIDSNEHGSYSKQEAIFESLLTGVEQLLERFGRPNYVPGQPPGDFSVHGDFTGYPQVAVFVTNLEMLRPPVVGALQQLISRYPGWQIMMTVAIRGHEEWPNMGLYIRPHEIIDALQRQCLPEEFQDLEYQGARIGTAYD